MRWAAAETISSAGTAVSSVVLPLVVYQLTGSAAQTGGLFALRVVPYLCFGAFAGPVADRGNRRHLIIGGNVIEGLLMATIPIAHAAGVLTVAQLYAVGLLSATAFVFSDAAVFGAVPALVGRERIGSANGLLASLASTADIVGPSIGGFLAAWIGPTNAVWLDSASFFVAAAIVSSIRSNFRATPLSDGPRPTVREQLGRALGFVRRQRTVGTLLLVGFGNSFGVGIVVGLTVPYAVQQLGLADDDRRIGLIYSAGGVGSLLAGVIVARVFRPERVRWLTPLMLVSATLLVGGLAATTALVAAVALTAVFFCAIGTTIVVGISYRQLAAPDDLRSSVNVFGRMVAWGGQPFGAATGAFVAGAMTVRTAYVIAAAVMGATAVTAAIRLQPSTAIDEPPDALVVSGTS